MDSITLEQNLKCPICLTIADEPYETSCCGHIFCAKCIQAITTKTSCPICRSNNFFFRENTFVKILLNTSNVVCSYGCGLYMPLSQVKLHRYLCEAALFKCSMGLNGQPCNFEGPKNEALTHFAVVHCDQMVVLAENYSSLKNTFDKSSLVDKIMKKQKAERDKNVLMSYKEDEYLNEFFENNINLRKDSEAFSRLILPRLNMPQLIKKDN